MQTSPASKIDTDYDPQYRYYHFTLLLFITNENRKYLLNDHKFEIHFFIHSNSDRNN